MTLILVNNLTKNYLNYEYKISVPALKGINFSVEEGELIGIMGPSGAGKTTLLSIIGGLLNPTKGTVIVNGKNVAKLTQKEAIEFRRNVVGFLWQLPEDNLIKNISILKNVMIPLQIADKPLEEQKRLANDLLDRLGLSHRKDHKPNQISGGEAQRAGLAVALANNPMILLGDQITGELDTKTSIEVVNHLKNIKDELGTTMIIASHKKSFTEITDRTFELRDGRFTKAITFTKNGRIEKDMIRKELLVIDSSGNLQLPPDVLKKVKANEFLQVEVENGVIKLVPEDGDKKEELDEE